MTSDRATSTMLSLLCRQHFLSLALVTAAALCTGAPATPDLYPSSSSSSSPAAAAAVPMMRGSERETYEQGIIERIKQRIISELGVSVDEDGAVVRANGTPAAAAPRRPHGGSEIINASTPINISIDGTRVAGARRRPSRDSGDYQFKLDVVKKSTVSVVNASVRVYVRRKSLAPSGERRRRRFANVAIYRVIDEAVDRYPLAQMSSRVRRGRPLELLLPTTVVDEALDAARPEARVLRLRIVCHHCRLANRRGRPGQHFRRGRAGRHSAMSSSTSRLVRRRRRGGHQPQSSRMVSRVPSLVIAIKVKEMSQQPEVAWSSSSNS